jgi:iron complex outermembrane recepter protein
MRSLRRTASRNVSAAGCFSYYRKLWVSLGRRWALAVLMMCGMFPVVESLAAETEASGPQLQEVLVTAQKVTQDVQKVPVAVTVLSAEVLAEQGARDFTTVLSEVPNLAFQYGTAGASGMGMSSSRGIAIRGISGANVTSVYIDDTPVPVSIDPHLLDIDHIEVLKGPQGTLYGEASMGGTVKIATVQPSSQAVGGNVDVDGHDLDGGGFGTFDSFNVNVPLSKDLLGMRVGAFYLYDPGFLTRTWNDPSAINGQYANPALGVQTVSHVGANTSYGGSAALRFEPEGSGLVIEPKFMAETTHSSGFLATDNSTSNYVQRRVLNVPEAWTDTFYLTALDVEVDTSIGKLISSTSDFYRDSYDQEDGSDVTQQLVYPTKAPLPVVGLTNLYDESFTQEFRLETDITRDLHTTAGLYYTDVLETYDESVQSPGAPGGDIPGFNAATDGTAGTDTGYLSHQPERSSEKAIYFSAAYSLTNRFKLSAGVRQSYLKSFYTNTTYGFFNGGYGHYTLPYEANALTPRFTAQYQLTDDDMVYATAAKGFRPGGAQLLEPICAQDLAALGLVPGESQYKSDALWNYEFGAKTKWFDGRLTANVAVYDMEWKDIQQVVRLPICGFDITVNGAAARSRGSELEVAYVPVEGLTMSLSGGYEDARITGVLPNSGSLYVGQRLNGVPEVTAAASVKYEWPTPFLGHMFFRVDDNYVGNSLSLNNSTIIGRYRPAYDLLDLRLGTDMMNNLVVSVYAKNVLDSHPNLGDEVAEVVETIGRPRYIVGDPMSVGVEVQKKF